MELKSYFHNEAASIDEMLDYLEDQLPPTERIRFDTKISENELELEVMEGMKHLYQHFEEAPRTQIKTFFRKMDQNIDTLIHLYQETNISSHKY